MKSSRSDRKKRSLKEKLPIIKSPIKKKKTEELGEESDKDHSSDSSDSSDVLKMPLIPKSLTLINAPSHSQPVKVQSNLSAQVDGELEEFSNNLSVTDDKLGDSSSNLSANDNGASGDSPSNLSGNDDGKSRDSSSNSSLKDKDKSETTPRSLESPASNGDALHVDIQVNHTKEALNDSSFYGE